MTDFVSDSLPETTAHDGWGPFHKSTFSGGGGCVEVAMSSAGEIRVRDSKVADSPVLSFNRREWDAFLNGVRAGEFELP